MQHTEKAPEGKPIAEAPSPSAKWFVLVDWLMLRAARLLDILDVADPESVSGRFIMSAIFDAIAELVAAAKWCGEMAMVVGGAAHRPGLLEGRAVAR